MNIKNIHLILSFIAFALTVLSSPIKESEDSLEESLSEVESNDGPTLTVDVSDSEVETDSAIEDPTGKPVDGYELCNTPECVEEAKRILAYMDQEANPCEDFYEFACGNYMKNNEIPDDKYAIGTVYDSSDENTKKIIEVIEEDYKGNPSLSEDDQKLDKINAQKVKDFYNSCMDVEALNKLGKKPLVDLLDELKIYENKEKYNTPEGLTDLLVKTDRYGLHFLIDSFFYSDLENSKYNGMYIGQPNLNLVRPENYNNDATANAYKSVIKGMLTNVYSDKKDRDIDAMSESVFDFEKKLSSIIMSDSEILGNPSTFSYVLVLISSNPAKRSNIDELQKLYPFIQWGDYLEKLSNEFGGKNVFKKDSPIMIATDAYFEKLVKLLKETKSETIAYFAEWNVIKTFGEYLGSEVTEPLKLLNQITTGAADQARSNYCIKLLNDNLTLLTSKLFVEKTFSGDSKLVGEQLIENILQSMMRRIQDIDWLDETTKKNALKKAKSLTYKIGYPDFILDPKKLYARYESLEMNPATFFENMAKSRKFESAHSLLKYGTPVSKDEWLLPPHVLNALSEPTTNQLVFLAGILQTPFFNSKVPSYINYGRIGSIIGHELSHSFDNSGKRFDEEGRLNNWWTNSTDAEFQKLSQCFIDQYDQYYIVDQEGKKIYNSGRRTLGENIGDNGGIARSYDAWKYSLEHDPKAKQYNKALPGLSKYTYDQLFYIAYGQLYCAKIRKEAEISIISIDEHPLEKFRTNGVVVNSETFAKAFNCPVNSPMNPEKKCVIW